MRRFLVRPGLSVAGPRPVALLEKVRLNGVDQWILIRGADQSKPVLPLLHGGLGMPAMFLAHAFQRDLERDFVVVHWDRHVPANPTRRAMRAHPPTVRQTLDDTYALTQLLRQRLGEERIYLVGLSWGSYLGLLAVSERAELYHAYVGMGQMAVGLVPVR